jgi:hypothetical protein
LSGDVHWQITEDPSGNRLIEPCDVAGEVELLEDRPGVVGEPVNARDGGAGQVPSLGQQLGEVLLGGVVEGLVSGY